MNTDTATYTRADVDAAVTHALIVERIDHKNDLDRLNDTVAQLRAQVRADDFDHADRALVVDRIHLAVERLDRVGGRDWFGRAAKACLADIRSIVTSTEETPS